MRFLGNRIEQVALGVLALALLLLPVIPGLHLANHNLARLVQLVLFVLCAVALVLQPERWQHLLGRLWFWPLLAGLLLSCALAAYPWIALRELALWLGLLMVGALVQSYFSRHGIDGLLKGLVLSSLWAGLLCLVLALAVIASGGPWDPWALVQGYDNVRFLNHVQTVTLPLLLLANVKWCGQARWERAAQAALAGQVLLYGATLGRATLVSWVLAGLLASCLNRREMWRLVRAAWRPVLTGALCAAVLFELLPAMLGLELVQPRPAVSNGGTALTRWALWHQSWSDMLQSPWWGVGPMHYAHHFNGTAAHPHNVYLQCLGEVGIPLSFLMFGVLFTWLYGRFRALARQSGDTRSGMVAWWMAAAVCVDGFFSGNFVLPQSQLWIALVFGMLAAMSADAHQPPATGEGPWPARTARTLAGACLCLHLLSLGLAVGELQQAVPGMYTAQGQAWPGMDRFSPRFWLQGWF